MTMQDDTTGYVDEQLKLRHELDNEYMQFLRLKQTMVDIGLVKEGMSPKVVADIIEAVVVGDISKITEAKEAYDNRKQEKFRIEFEIESVVGMSKGQLIQPSPGPYYGAKTASAVSLSGFKSVVDKARKEMVRKLLHLGDSNAEQ